MVFFLIMMLMGVADSQEKRAEQERSFLVKDTAIGVQHELVLAAGAHNGYERTFTLPLTLLNQAYTVALVDNLVYLSTADGKHSLALPIPQVNGTLILGDNRIRKTDGRVYLN